MQLHQAADGPLARIRLPGGYLEPQQLQTLAAAAADLGNGELELTVRGNIQLRAVSDPDELARRVADAGLLPSLTHERARNIVASPLTGRVGGALDVREHVRALDELLQADADLAGLPGRVLFSIDDGSDDVSGLGADVGLHAVSNHEFALLLAGADSGARIPIDDGVAHVIAAARTFLDLRSDEWRLAEVEGGPARVLAALAVETVDAALDFAAGEPPIGWLPQDDGLVSLGAGLRLGVLPARTAEFIAAVERPIIVTPWRTLLLCDLDEAVAETVVRVLAPMGLIFDANSPWLQVSACAGQPGCAKALADVRSDLTEVVESGLPIVGRQHWSGCGRRCGRPRGDVIDVIAPDYQGL